MGCAQETFEYILSFLHREYVKPDYQEKYNALSANDKFQLDQRLDGQGCSPACAAHHTFGVELQEIVECQVCQRAEHTKESEAPQFMHLLYVAEILALQEQDPEVYQSLPLVIGEILRAENEYKLERSGSTFPCDFCG